MSPYRTNSIEQVPPKFVRNIVHKFARKLLARIWKVLLGGRLRRRRTKCCNAPRVEKSRRHFPITDCSDYVCSKCGSYYYWE